MVGVEFFDDFFEGLCHSLFRQQLQRLQKRREHSVIVMIDLSEAAPLRISHFILVGSGGSREVCAEKNCGRSVSASVLGSEGFQVVTEDSEFFIRFSPGCLLRGLSRFDVTARTADAMVVFSGAGQNLSVLDHENTAAGRLGFIDFVPLFCGFLFIDGGVQVFFQPHVV